MELPLGGVVLWVLGIFRVGRENAGLIAIVVAAILLEVWGFCCAYQQIIGASFRTKKQEAQRQQRHRDSDKNRDSGAI